MTTSNHIKPIHLARQAIIDVRQSTAQQAIHNQESLRLQYALRDRAIGLGWSDQQVVVIDSDLGKSGSTAQGRLGFQDLVSRVSLNQAGAIFAFDVIPRRVRGGADVRWREPTKSAVSSMLRNPTYAGAYAYGKTRFVPQKSASHKRYKQRIDQDQWKVLIQDRHPPYITWDQFMAIQKTLEENLARYNSLNSAGTPREGAALLQGIVYCGRCGHQMTIQYRQGGQYRCNYLYQSRCLPVCLTTPSLDVDSVVTTAVLDAVNKAEFDLFEQSLRELDQRQAAMSQAKSQELERLRYEAQRAEKQYQLCDPENRLIASELERKRSPARLLTDGLSSGFRLKFWSNLNHDTSTQPPTVGAAPAALSIG